MLADIFNLAPEVQNASTKQSNETSVLQTSNKTVNKKHSQGRSIKTNMSCSNCHIP